MKVINKVVITLALAVPTSTLVTADELVINTANHTFNAGAGQYTPDMREALKISLIGFEQVVVVPPGYDKSEADAAGTVRIGNGLQPVNLPHQGEIAARTEVLIP